MNTAQTFDFELVSPEQRLLSVAATMAVVPGEEGHIGVLPNHSALVASVQPGVVEVFVPGEAAAQRIFISGGFADISADNCTILAEEAIKVDDLDEGALEQQINNLTEDMGLAEGAADRARIARAQVLAKAKLGAVTGRIIL